MKNKAMSVFIVVLFMAPAIPAVAQSAESIPGRQRPAVCLNVSTVLHLSHLSTAGSFSGFNSPQSQMKKMLEQTADQINSFQIFQIRVSASYGQMSKENHLSLKGDIGKLRTEVFLLAVSAKARSKFFIDNA